jgi:subtilisin family serine protease
MSEQTVEIFGAEPGKKGALLNRFHDPKTGQYFALSYPKGDPFFAGVAKVHAMGFTGKGTTCAMLDTGMMLQHPMIKRNLQESIDLTGEGAEDLNGHGTSTTMKLLLTAPDTTLVNIKVVGADGRGEEKNLVRGIEVAVEKGVTAINMSLGVYHKKWGIWDCNGDCPVCLAAKKAAIAGVMITAAAGNEPGKTSCPAKLGMTTDYVISVAAFDFEKRIVPAYSGRGNLVAPSDGQFPLNEVDANGQIIAMTGKE